MRNLPSGRFFFYVMSSLKSLRMILGHAGLLLAWIAPDQVPPWTTYHHEFFMVVGVFL